MNFKDLAKNNRSYRRFDEKFVIERDTLVELISLARYAASGRNGQPLKYFLSNDRNLNGQIFSTLAWAGYLKEWPGPKEGERPSAYIIVLLDHNISDNYFCDDGIAMQNILLGAVEKGLGGCILRSIDKPRLSAILNLPGHLEITDVVAIGKPVETVLITNVGEDGDIRYYRDGNGVHYVPKRSLNELIINWRLAAGEWQLANGKL
jgi:nitroreductase